MRRDLVFLHVPKTGGTAVRNALVKALPGRRVLFDYGAASDATTPLIRDLVYGDGKGTVPADFRRRVDDPRGLFVAGHFRAGRYWRHFHAESFCTILRDPVDRVISEYNHFVTHRGLAGSIEDFIRRERPRLLTLLFGIIDPTRFGYIGFTDTLAEDVDALGAFVGAPVSLPRENEGVYEQGLAERASDPVFRAWVAEEIGEDMTLYTRLRTQFAILRRQRNARLAAATELRGRVRLSRGGVLVGYAVHPRIEAMLSVEVLVDGRLAATIPADRFAPYLRTLGLSRAGVGGFRLPLRSLSWLARVPGRQSEITVRFAGTGTALPGSPLTLRGRPI